MSEFEDYETTSKNYDRQRVAMGAEVVASMIQFHCKKSVEQIHLLDAGCGTGNYAKAMLDYGYGHVTMLDGSDGMLEKAKIKLADEISNGRVSDIRRHVMPTLPFDDSAFDAVMFNMVLHHVEGNADGVNFPGIQATLTETRRVLRTGGILSISTAFPSSYPARQWHERLEENIGVKYYKKFLEARQWLALFETTGFKTVSVMEVKADLPKNIKDIMYYPEGPAEKAWRDGNSYWAMATNDEIANVENKIRTMKVDGTLEQFVRDNDKSEGFYDVALLFAKAI